MSTPPRKSTPQFELSSTRRVASMIIRIRCGPSLSWSKSVHFFACETTDCLFLNQLSLPHWVVVRPSVPSFLHVTGTVHQNENQRGTRALLCCRGRGRNAATHRSQLATLVATSQHGTTARPTTTKPQLDLLLPILTIAQWHNASCADGNSTVQYSSTIV